MCAVESIPLQWQKDWHCILQKKGSSNTPYLSVEADWVNHTFYKTQRQPFEEGLPPFNMSEHNSQERTFR